MATARDRRARRVRLSTDRDDDRAIAALRDELARERPGQRIDAYLMEQEVVRRGKTGELSAAAQRSVKAFGRDAAALGKRLGEGVQALQSHWGSSLQFDKALPPARDLLHVYGPDVAGTGGPWFYRLAWTHIDDTAGAGIGANVDLNKGTMWASHYALGPGRNAYAGIGVRLVPRLDWCQLSVRPYLNWAGFDTLTHRVHDPQLDETRWATSIGLTGIIVQSWNASGSAYNLDARHFVGEWQRQEPNPSGSRDYAGLSSSGTGLQVDVLASGERQYAVWVCVQAFVAADPGFGTSTYASGSISGALPFVVVEEIPI
jgi:hypothetical protein